MLGNDRKWRNKVLLMLGNDRKWQIVLHEVRFCYLLVAFELIRSN